MVQLVEHKAPAKPRRINVDLIPRNLAQEEYVSELHNVCRRLVFATGPAGTGKTLLATLKAIQSLIRGDTDKIIITRPTVGASEDIGYLPGDLNEKMEPWVLPILDIFHEFWTKEETAQMLFEGTIEIAPLAYMRGRTFKNSIILLDEAQNCTPEQMKLILTRIGEYSRIFVTGDLEQTDHKKSNGLDDITTRLIGNGSNSFALCKFRTCDVERDPVVQEILELYAI